MSRERRDKLTNEEKKRQLYKYKKLTMKILDLQEQKESIRAEIESAKNQIITDMPRGGRQKDLGDYISELEGIELSIKEKIREKNKKRVQIESAIMELEDGVESDIIRKRYIEFKEWEEICTDIGYSWKQTHRKHGNALVNIKMT